MPKLRQVAELQAEEALTNERAGEGAENEIGSSHWTHFKLSGPMQVQAVQSGALRAILGGMAIMQQLPVDEGQLELFCQRWKITKLELFGSALTDPAHARDVDLLVTFAQDARWGLFEHEHMQNELAGLLGCRVDLISRRAIEASRNALRRGAILSRAVPVYVAG